jgi:hypothetical protein
MDLLINLEPSTEVDEATTFYPDFLDNLEKPEDERAGFLLKKISGKVLQQIERAAMIKASRAVRSQNEAAAAGANADAAKRERVLREYVTPLRWFKKDAKSGDRTEIKTCDELRAVVMQHPKIPAAVAIKLFDDAYNAAIGNSTLSEDLLGESK